MILHIKFYNVWVADVTVAVRLTKALSYPRQARKQASGDPSGRVGNDDVNKGAWQEFCLRRRSLKELIKILTVFCDKDNE